MLSSKEAETYWLGVFGSFLNPHEPTYPLWKQKWECLLSLVPDVGPSTCSLPWRAVSLPPSCQELYLWLVSGLFNLKIGPLIQSQMKERTSRWCFFWAICMRSSIKGGKNVLLVLCLTSIHSFWPPKKIQMKTQQLYMRKVVTWMIW